MIPFFENCLAWARKAASKYIAASCSGWRRQLWLGALRLLLSRLTRRSRLTQSVLFPFQLFYFIDNRYLPRAARNPETAWGVQNLSHLYPTCNVCVAFASTLQSTEVLSLGVHFRGYTLTIQSLIDDAILFELMMGFQDSLPQVLRHKSEGECLLSLLVFSCKCTEVVCLVHQP